MILPIDLAPQHIYTYMPARSDVEDCRRSRLSVSQQCWSQPLYIEMTLHTFPRVPTPTRDLPWVGSLGMQGDKKMLHIR